LVPFPLIVSSVEHTLTMKEAPPLSDFTTINLVYNTATFANADVTGVWTGTALAFGGTAGANELRWAMSTTPGTTTTASANWPFVTRTGSTFAIDTLWAFTADAVGLQINAYNGANSKSNQMRWSWDAVGSYAAAPQFSAFQSTAHTNPTPGDGTITGGASPDTSTVPSSATATSYLKINAYGNVIATTATLVAAGPAGTAPTVTTGAQSLTTTTAGTNWLNTNGAWASAQGFSQGGIIFASVPAATTANTWPWLCALFCGLGLTTGTLTPVITLQYSF